MPKPLTIELTPEQQQELEYARDHHEKPYVRERAAAILKIAAGMSGRQVALHGLLSAGVGGYGVPTGCFTKRNGTRRNTSGSTRRGWSWRSRRNG